MDEKMMAMVYRMLAQQFRDKAQVNSSRADVLSDALTLELTEAIPHAMDFVSLTRESASLDARMADTLDHLATEFENLPPEFQGGGDNPFPFA